MMKMKVSVAVSKASALLLSLLVAGACNAAQPGATDPALVLAQGTGQPPGSKQVLVSMTVGERRFAVSLADTAAARAFAAQLPLTLDMSDLNANEKKVSLPTALPTNATRPGTIRNGDIMLYGSDTLVVFYKTFDSIYSYTRLGRVDDPTGLAEALGKGDVKVTFSKG